MNPFQALVQVFQVRFSPFSFRRPREFEGEGGLALAIMAVAATLRADSSWVGKWGVGLDSGYSTHAMADVNEEWKDLGATYNGEFVDFGPQAGADIEYWVVPEVRLGFQFNDFYDLSSVAVLDDLSILSEHYNATEYLARADYVFSGVVPRLDFRIGIAIGAVVMTGDNYQESDGGSTATINLSGEGLDEKYFVGADYFFIPSLSLGVDVGYRYAFVPTVQFSSTQGNGTATLDNGANLTADYSGFDSEVRLQWWFGGASVPAQAQ